MRAVVLLALAAAVATAAYVPHAHHAHHAQHFGETTRARIAANQPLVDIQVNDTIDVNGWIGLKIRKSQHASSIPHTHGAVWYAAGFAEGTHLTTRIQQHFINTIQNSTNLDQTVLNWIESHVAWMQLQVSLYNSTDRFWKHTGLLMMQLQGITDGYNSVAPASEQLTFFDIFLLNYQYELDDITTKLGTSSPKQFRPPAHRGGCTGYVKPTATDLFMTHTTWAGYIAMIRVFKDVDLGGVRIAWSGYPGIVHSGDDWYMLSSGLTVFETTNLIYNNGLYRFTVPEAVSEFLRVMIANYLAVDGPSWTNTFARYNSGTYNNQYVVVNHNLYTTGTAAADLPDNLVWIVEQLPGMAPMADVTPVIREKGYWEAYNLPYFNVTYVASGNARMYEQYGDYFSYTKYARPQIIKRNQANITDIEGVKNLIRFNQWQTDPLSACPGCSPATNPELSIACRGDLIPANGTWGTWAPFINGGPPMGMAFGAIDAKIASHTMFMQNFTGVVVSGPTHETQTPFQWSTAPEIVRSAPHVGQADLQRFDWINTGDLFQ